jgi:hypothetical protein
MVFLHQSITDVHVITAAMPELLPLPPDNAAWLSELKSRIHKTRQRATLAVNRVPLLLYWPIGRGILASTSP